MIVALYARVSTGKQAEKELSIPDQLRQMKEWCERRGHEVAGEYVEPGASATDDKRPVFQEMIHAACLDESLYVAIIVHSFSRFFRDVIDFGLYERRLKKHGVDVLSITQETHDDPVGQMVRRIFNVFDEYQSKENSKHTLRAMEENARQGFFNGAKPPYGYRAVDAVGMGRRGKKKKLEVDEVEAQIVRRIYNLYLNGKDGRSMGIVAIGAHLNAIGITRRGSKWGRSRVHELLTNTAYVGEYYFNRKRTKTGEVKPESEWIPINITPIIEPEVFEKVRKRLESRSPATIPPRLVNTPNLLTGLLKCGKCGSGMTLATGKSGKYRYYKCARKASMGAGSCESRNLPMDELDGMILDLLAERLFTPERVALLLDILKKRLRGEVASQQPRLRLLDTELREVTVRIERLYEAVESGMLPVDSSLQERVQKHKARREEILLERSAMERNKEIPFKELNKDRVVAFCLALREKIRDKGSHFGREYLRLLLDEIVVDGREVVVRGQYRNLIGAIKEKLGNSKRVPSFVTNWLPGTDSNHQPSG
jgi:site-specific DNA recombinase